VTRLSHRLILAFLAATLVPLGVTSWIATVLLDRSLSYASTAELDELSLSLEQTGREFYQRARESLQQEAAAGRLEPVKHASKDRGHWPPDVAAFYSSGEARRFTLSGVDGDRLNYLERRGGEVWVYSRRLGAVGMDKLSRQLTRARDLVERSRVYDLRRGFTLTFIAAAAAVWTASLAVMIWLARRMSRPIQDLTAGLRELASGNLKARVSVRSQDEVGLAMQAFNDMAEQLEASRQRLIYLTRLAGWQTLARKMAHEIKNSLTPIRLTMDELVARGAAGDRAFLEQAAEIVTQEVESLERRVRSFSDLAAEPPVRPMALDVNSLVEDRIALLRSAHPGVIYNTRLAKTLPPALADEDLLKGVLTNLLENAAQAAGGGGVVLAATQPNGKGGVAIEVHDSGAGLSQHARETLFEPSISFKKGGMGLGLSIARKSALLCGGDILLVKGELSGAAFRVVLRAAGSG
jgi:nitrogen fixation/metabolism regulation signal transduction histidine kinase